ncbi:ATP-binding protein [Mycobacterium sp. NAZ190054]|uniref:ATP-binding protein n=1 Tax=Mycobacterium sp. NAZ190054 TaxID=1747766 RepID=UPI00079C568B|nr:ATP-binding protein [Mycobacterium sp. NAZ190054]KWX56953.1 histidine kinase [Mycobacterium sp. NAZ190054]
MGEKCLPDELRTLFLFEALSDEQLATLCANGHIETFEPGPIHTEGDPATCFYVLIDGELVMSKRSGGVDIETNRTSQRGVYCGAWSAYIPGEEHVYQASVRVTRPSRFFVLDADAFAEFMQKEFPMAVHLLEGHMVGGLRQRQILGQREKLLALGQLSAGLTHQLNNPAGATARAVADLREGVGKMRHKLAMLADGEFTPAALKVLVSIQDEVAEYVAKSKSQELTALEASDREDQIGDWLEDHGISAAWDYAPTFVEAGLDVDWLERVEASVDDVDCSATLPGAIGWLKYTIDNELLMNQIAEASKRISALLAGAKQYSQMDRAEYQKINVHELLFSTVKTIFGDKLGKDKVNVVWDKDKTLPELSCYPGDLNQVWTNLIDNAIQAMDGHGTLTIRTRRQSSDAGIVVEICDDGPGIPEDIVDRIFTPFFTTKPFGEGTGLGLDLAWRIVVEKHHGHLAVESRPGDTRFIVSLPWQAPAPENPTKVGATSDD